jgi:hypothetical protein
MERFYKVVVEWIARQRRKPTLGGRLLFLFVSDRGVSCLRQQHDNARKVVMDWNQVRKT